MPKVEDSEARAANGRLRQFTFQQRKQYPLRLPRDIYDRLSAASSAASITNTHYVGTVLELWLAGKRDVRGLPLFVERIDDGRLTVTIRLLPSLFARTKAAAQTANVSMNRLITFVLDRSLRAP